MSDILEDYNNCVGINGRKIPVINIQVENVPGYNAVMDDWYGVYFEILFEDGSLWVVTQKSEETDDDSVYVTAYDNFNKVVDGTKDYSEKPDREWSFKNWDDFLIHYDEEIWGMSFDADFAMTVIMEPEIV